MKLMGGRIIAEALRAHQRLLQIRQSPAKLPHFGAWGILPKVTTFINWLQDQRRQHLDKLGCFLQFPADHVRRAGAFGLHDLRPSRYSKFGDRLEKKSSL